jgi:hypothetical protein
MQAGARNRLTWQRRGGGKGQRRCAGGAAGLRAEGCGPQLPLVNPTNRVRPATGAARPSATAPRHWATAAAHPWGSGQRRPEQRPGHPGPATKGKLSLPSAAAPGVADPTPPAAAGARTPHQSGRAPAPRTRPHCHAPARASAGRPRLCPCLRRRRRATLRQCPRRQRQPPRQPWSPRAWLPVAALRPPVQRHPHPLLPLRI